MAEKEKKIARFQIIFKILHSQPVNDLEGPELIIRGVHREAEEETGVPFVHNP